MRRPAIFLVVVALVLSGCATPLRVGRDELTRLDGFERTDAVALRGLGGKAAPFTSRTRLGLVLAGGEEIVHRYRSVRVVDGVFYGLVDGTEAQVAVALQDVDHARLWPEGAGESGPVALMVLTMWLLLGALVGIGYAIYHNVDFDDVDLDIVIYSR